MKFTKSISLSLESIDIIDAFMEERKMVNFSKAVNMLIIERKRFFKI
ncbi:unnamed protein product, partial [marine sediment metagenome]